MNVQSAIPDEFPATTLPTEPAQWSENYALMCSNPGDRLALFYGTGRWHADREIWRELIVVVLPNGRVLCIKGFGRNGDHLGPGGSLAKFDIVVAGRKAHLRFDGPVWEFSNAALLDQGFRDGSTDRCRIDVTFESDLPVWDMKGSSVAASTIAGSIHAEQVGTCNGVIQYKGKTYAFTNGYSIRDHSRGVRNISQFKRHCWISGRFDGGRAFHLYTMEVFGSGAAPMGNAVVIDNSKCYPAEVLEVEYLSGAKDIGKTHSLAVRSELGVMRIDVKEVLATVITGMVHPYDTLPGALPSGESALIFDEPVRLEWEGRQGYGWSERGMRSTPFSV